MNEYVQEVLDILWEIEGWKRDDLRDAKNVRKLLKEFSPEIVNLTAVARDMDWWCSEKADKPEPSMTLMRSFAKRAVARGEAPHPMTISGAIFSVEEQLRLKDVKRRAELERMGIRD